MHTYSSEIEQLKTNLKTKLNHSYLNKFIQQPLINMDKIYIFYNLYNLVNIPRENKEKLITTIMLVDIALSTHESVPTHQLDGEMDETELQLSVLAGDYYSSQYYYILSQLEDVKMISLLANAIKLSSDNKMRLFYNNVDSIHEFFQIMKETEALFYEVVAKELQHPQLIPVIREYLLINKLVNEKLLIQQAKRTTLLNYIELSRLNYGNLTPFTIINNEIDRCLHEIDKHLIELPYQYADVKVYLTNKLNLNYQANRTIVEEG